MNSNPTQVIGRGRGRGRRPDHGGPVENILPMLNNIKINSGNSSTAAGSGCIQSIDLMEVKWNLIKPAYTVEGDEKHLSNEITKRVGHSIVNGVGGSRKAYLMGGADFDVLLYDIWTLDFSGISEGEDLLTVSLHPEKILPGRYEFASALDRDTNAIYIFGGSGISLDDSGLMNDVWELDIETKSMLEKFVCTLDASKQTSDSSQVPSGRTQGSNHALIEIKGKKYMAIFGGGLKGDRSVPDGNLYLFDTEACSWSKVDVSGRIPTPRQGHLMVSFGSKVFVYGGMEGVEFYNDLFMIDLLEESPSWIKLPQKASNGTDIPTGRAAHNGFIKGSDIYILGGLSETGALNDLWKYNIDSHCWKEIKVGNKLPENKFPVMFDFAVNIITTWKDSKPNEKYDMIIVHGGMNITDGILGDFWLLPLGLSKSN